MGGTVSSSEKSSSKTTQPNTKYQVTPSRWEDAVVRGNHLVVEEGVRERLGQVADMMDAYRRDDYKHLLKNIEEMSEDLKKKGIEISGPIKKAMAEHHKAILYNIDEAVKDQYNRQLTQEDKNAYIESKLEDRSTYEKIINKIDKTKDNPQALFTAFDEYFNKDLDTKISSIINDPVLENNQLMQDNITNVSKNIKSLKVRYKFFEYKYTQLNIFMILLIQHVFTTMDEFVSQVLTFSQQRDILREEMVKKTFDVINDIMKSADLNIDPTQFNQMNGLLAQLSQQAKDKEASLKANIDALSTIAKTNMEHFLGSLSDVTRAQASSFLATTAAKRGGGMVGGFPKGSSHFPPSFFEASGSHEGTAPRGNSI